VALSKLYRAWKQTDRKLKTSAAVLLAAAVADIAVSALTLGRVETLLRLDALAALAEMVAFYVFFVPLMMYLIQRDIQRGRADAIDLVVLLILLHVMVTNMFKLALEFG
jgi:hypothetical protein